MSIYFDVNVRCNLLVLNSSCFNIGTCISYGTESNPVGLCVHTRLVEAELTPI